MSYENKIVSVIVPVRNEEEHVVSCIESILKQDYPVSKLEVIFVDGLSDDYTRTLIESYVSKQPETFSLYINQNKTVPYAMNIGIEKSKGKYIIRLDAHSIYPNDYISRCINTLVKTDADNVGGLAYTQGRNKIGNAFSKVLSSKFGVGNSGFRTKASSGYVDTVPFGAFKRETFEKYGVYDERLVRNQDYELNYRIRKHGGKIYLNSDISLTYFCRSRIDGIVKQSFENGKWNVITYKLCPGSMSLRHFIPLLFVLSLILLPILTILYPFFYYVVLIEIVLYSFLGFYSAINSSKDIVEFCMIIALFPIFHISYGIGSLSGIFSNL